MPTVVPYTALTGVYTIDPAHSTIGFSAVRLSRSYAA